MSKFEDIVQWIQKNPPSCTRESRRKTELELESAFNDDLEAIRSGELEDTDRFVDGFSYAIGDLIEVFVESIMKED